MRRAAAALAAAVALVAPSSAHAGSWNATNSLEMQYVGDVTNDVAEARVGNAGGGPALLYEWPAPGTTCAEATPEGRCIARGGHWLASRFVAELGAGDDVFSVWGPAPDPASRLNGIRYDGGPDRDMIYSRLDRSETQLSGQYGIANGGTGDDMLDLRDVEGSSVDCGPGEDTAYLDPPGTTEHGFAETWQNCEHVTYGPDPLAAVDVALSVPASGLTGDQAPRLEALEARAEPGSVLGPGRFECRLVEQFWRPCAAGEPVAAPGDGAKALLVRWIAADGTIGDALGLLTWRVDTVPPPAPVVTRRSYAAAGHVQERIAFGAPERVEGFTCEIDGAGPAPCSSPLVLVDPAPGARSVDVRSVDAAGNRSAAVGVRWSVAAARVPTVSSPSVRPSPKGNPAAFILRSVTAKRVARGLRVGAACRLLGKPIACTVRWRASGRTLARDKTGKDGKAVATIARKHLHPGRTLVLRLVATGSPRGGGTVQVTVPARFRVPRR